MRLQSASTLNDICLHHYSLDICLSHYVVCHVTGKQFIETGSNSVVATEKVLHSQKCLITLYYSRLGNSDCVRLNMIDA